MSITQAASPFATVVPSVRTAADPAVPNQAGNRHYGDLVVKESLAIDTLLFQQLDAGAEDLHLKVGEGPWVTHMGRTRRLDRSGDFHEFDPSTMMDFLRPLATSCREDFDYLFTDKRLDFAYSTPRSRFRVHFGLSQGDPYANFRSIALNSPSLADLHAPKQIHDLVNAKPGLNLLVGVTGSGKSSTQSGVIGGMNETQSRKIVLLEDPTEFVHKSNQSLIVQREVGPRKDVASFAAGTEDAMREMPDVIVIGEMRDRETMAAALTAASSGHIVFATIHAESAVDAVTRIIDSVPADRVHEVRSQLARTLRTVVYQKLIMRKGGKTRAMAAEVLINNPIIRKLIEENNLVGVANQMNLPDNESTPMGVALADLYLRGDVMEETARDAELVPGSFDDAVKANKSKVRA